MFLKIRFYVLNVILVKRWHRDNSVASDFKSRTWKICLVLFLLLIKKLKQQELTQHIFYPFFLNQSSVIYSFYFLSSLSLLAPSTMGSAAHANPAMVEQHLIVLSSGFTMFSCQAAHKPCRAERKCTQTCRTLLRRHLGTQHNTHCTPPTPKWSPNPSRHCLKLSTPPSFSPPAPATNLSSDYLQSYKGKQMVSHPNEACLLYFFPFICTQNYSKCFQ